MTVATHETGGLLPVALIILFSALLVFVSPIAAIMVMAVVMLVFVVYGASRDEEGKSVS